MGNDCWVLCLLCVFALRWPRPLHSTSLGNTEETVWPCCRGHTTHSVYFGIHATLGGYQALSCVSFIGLPVLRMLACNTPSFALSAGFCPLLPGCDCFFLTWVFFCICPTELFCNTNRPHQSASLSKENFSHYFVFCVGTVALGNWSYNLCAWGIFLFSVPFCIFCTFLFYLLLQEYSFPCLLWGYAHFCTLVLFFF